MKRMLACLMVLALALATPLCLAEEQPEELLLAQQERAESAVEEASKDLSLAEVLSPDAALNAGEEETETPEEEPPEAPVAEPEVVEPLEAQVISITKSAKKTVYMAVPYVLNVKNGIRSAKSSDTDVATVAKDGTVTLVSTGKAKITIKTGSGKKLTVTLNVEPAPAPGNLRFVAEEGGVRLSWSAAKFATGYLAQISENGKKWTDFKRLKAGKRSLDVTDAVAAPAWFRVVAILGDVYGGASASISFLGPISGVRVICEETKYEGPTNRMNVVWDACNGATGYEVYHAALPSDDYKLLGTTDRTWFPVTRALTRLDAYRVKPLYGDMDLPWSDPVTLWTGYQDNVLPPANLESSTGIILVVNKKAQVVTAYVRDGDGEYTIPLRHMICSSGKVYDRTKNGTYKLKSRKGQWYQYPSGCYIRWPSIYRSGYYFHSPLYYSSKKIMTSTVRRLGTRQSLGCIRLKVFDAEWIYKNCDAGTAVYICDGKSRDSLRKALKPRTVKVSGF